MGGQKSSTLAWTNILDHSGALGDSFGWVVGGFNSDPADVIGLSGTATYTGVGGVSVYAQDSSFWTRAHGGAVLNLDFDTMNIDGHIDLIDCGCGTEGFAIADTTMTLNSTDIIGNVFSGTASINAADFGLSGIGTISADGMFYESGATAVGGDISGVATATPENGGVTVFLNGAFLADDAL